MTIKEGLLNLGGEGTSLKGLLSLKAKMRADKIAPPTKIIKHYIDWAQVCPCATESNCGPLAKLVSFGCLNG